jgi:TRAP transporter TAXI family solute receptor
MKVSLSRLLFVVAALIALTTASAIAYVLWSRPVDLRVAAGPAAGKDAAILAAFDKMLAAAGAGVRLKLVATAGLNENNALLGKREVDLAVVRLDEAMPATAALVVIMRTDALIVVVPATHKLENVPDLAGKRVGLVVRTPLDEPSFASVLDVFGLEPKDVKLTVVKPEEVGPLTTDGRIDAVVVVGVPADPEVSAVVYAVAGTKKSPPSILAVDIGGALKQSSAAADAVKIPKHAFARRLIPGEEIETVGVPTVLAANRIATGPVRTKVYHNAITELTKGLIERRLALARQVPLASLIAAPDHEKGARFPLHPGAEAYLADTDVSWFTLLSDQIWNILLIGGLLSSAFAGAAGFLKRSVTDPMRELLERLRAITDRARTATDPADAEVLRGELNAIAVEIAMRGYERHAGYEQFAPLQLAFENTRDAVDALRRRTARPRGEAGPAVAPAPHAA